MKTKETVDKVNKELMESFIKTVRSWKFLL